MTPDRLSQILPPGLTPRLLTKTQAAAYCGVSAPTFTAWEERGWVPGPIRRGGQNTGRYDRLAIDRALDKLSGIEAQSSALDQWRAENGAA